MTDIASPTSPSVGRGAIRRNLLFSLFGRAGSVLLNLATTLQIIHAIGPTNFGAYLLVVNIVTLVDLAIEIPLFEIVTREIARQRGAAKDWMAAANALRGIVAMLAATALLGCAAANVGNDPNLMILGAALVLVNWLRTPIALFRAELRIHHEMFPWCLSRALELLSVIILLRFTHSPAWLLAARVGTSAVFGIVVWQISLREYGERLAIGLRNAKPLLYASIPVGITSTLVLLQLKLDVLLIGWMRGEREAGLFGAVAQVPEFTLVANTILIGTIGPLLARVSTHETEQFQAIFSRTFAAMMLCLPACGLVAGLHAKLLIPLAFGKDFLPASAVFPIVVAACALIPVAGLLGITAITLNLQQKLIKVEVINILIYLGTNLLLLPTFGMEVSAWARLVVLVLGTINTYVVIVRHSPYRLHAKDVWISLVVASATAGVVLGLRLLNPYLSLAVGAAIGLLFTRSAVRMLHHEAPPAP